MNHFMQLDAFSSLNNAQLRGNVFSSNIRENLDNTSKFAEFEEEVDVLSKVKEHQFLFENMDEEIPKFHFPTLTADLPMTNSVEFSLKKNVDIDNNSVHSDTSTRANQTKELSSSGEDYLKNNINNYDLLHEEDINIEEVVSNTKKEQLPTLEQIFNLDPKTNIINSDQNNSTNIVKEVDINKEVDIIMSSTKQPKAKQDLSKRGDVVNKTILRAIKRYYFTEFDSLFSFSTLTDKEKFANFHEFVRKYVTEEMKGTKNLSDDDKEVAILFFGSMISHVHMRRGITISKIRTQVNFVHKCLYNYSHKKLSQLIKQGGFKFILDDFVNYDGIDVVLNSEETMLKDQDFYRDTCESLLLKAQE
mmetsp:Transcript_8887/g.7869  ORF Transcript_8887/g.7869 Transcript_8887/m.7869 type:complete len:361 (+) Transcript_8887:45-1127(+)